MPFINLESAGGISTISLNRPEKRNAMNHEMMRQMGEAIRTFQDSNDRVAVIRAEGDHFCAGADLGDPPGDIWKSMPNVGINMTKPIIAATQGWVIGAGFTLTMLSDFCIASSDARYSFPEGKVGVFGGIAAGLVVRIPQKIAVEFLMLGQPMSAQRFYELGMVNQIVEPEKLIDAAYVMAQSLAGLAPQVVASIKRWTNMTLPKAPAETFYEEMSVFNDMLKSNDFRVGLDAFQSKQIPVFNGN